MCSTGLTSCHQNLLGGAGHQKGSNPEGEYAKEERVCLRLCSLGRKMSRQIDLPSMNSLSDRARRRATSTTDLIATGGESDERTLHLERRAIWLMEYSHVSRLFLQSLTILH